MKLIHEIYETIVILFILAGFLVLGLVAIAKREPEDGEEQ